MLGLLIRWDPSAFPSTFVALVRAVGTAAFRLALPGLDLTALLWRAAALLTTSLLWFLGIGHVGYLARV
ncbi:hypothetical protein UK15_18325 [Streptomyces variegatus]|uniref:Uncharacterized protein n=1 Tax=Streptomyces variegatus TaxID=284040 RepID=A0A0M2GJR1_9ACTN|nr:hypothetical protein UK15_18325 [Streptomyces variegatus]